MKANELFDEFLTYCKDYEIIFDNIVITNGLNNFKLFKPKSSDQNDVFFESCVGKSREQGSLSDIDDLLELAIYTVGEEKIKSKQKSLYM